MDIVWVLDVLLAIQQNWLWPTESRPFVALNWQKIFGHYSTSVLVAPSSMPKLLTPLATIFVEILFQEKFGEVLDPFKLPHERNFWNLEKSGVLKFLEQVCCPGKFSGSWVITQAVKIWTKNSLTYGLVNNWAACIPCQFNVIIAWINGGLKVKKIFYCYYQDL